MFRAAAALLTAAMLAFAGCGGDDRPSGEAGKAEPAASDFRAAAADAVRDVEAGRALLLDVRTKREYADGHAPGALLLPHDAIGDGARPELAKDTKLVVYCQSGRRAAYATRVLREAGFTDVTNIGGLRDWKRAGGAVTS